MRMNELGVQVWEAGGGGKGEGGGGSGGLGGGGRQDCGGVEVS